MLAFPFLARRQHVHGNAHALLSCVHGGDHGRALYALSSHDAHVHACDHDHGHLRKKQYK